MYSPPLGLRKTLYLDLKRQQSLLQNEKNLKGARLWLSMLSFRFIPVLIFRLSAKSQQKNCSIIAKLFSLVNFVLFGLEIASVCRIGPGLFLPHTHGTVIGAVSIGSNATIYQGVTIGAKGLDFRYNKSLRPVIGDNVLLGAGAKVLGGITIGQHVTVGANAVVLDDIESYSLAAGIPAKVIARVEASC